MFSQDADRFFDALTLDECKSGWAVLELGQRQAPVSCVLSRRFAVKQGDKIRPIDDLSVSLVNQTPGTEEKIVVHPASCTLALALHLQAIVNNLQPCARFRRLKGRTFDLKWAYKQLGVHLDDLRYDCFSGGDVKPEVAGSTSLRTEAIWTRPLRGPRRGTTLCGDSALKGEILELQYAVFKSLSPAADGSRILAAKLAQVAHCAYDVPKKYTADAVLALGTRLLREAGVSLRAERSPLGRLVQSMDSPGAAWPFGMWQSVICCSQSQSSSATLRR